MRRSEVLRFPFPRAFTWHSRDGFRKRTRGRPNRLSMLSSCFNFVVSPGHSRPDSMLLRTRVSRMDNRMRSADIYWGPQLGLRILTLFLDLNGLDEGEEEWKDADPVAW
jgi:hypothetical protein